VHHQGGLFLSVVLDIMRQVVSGVRHLHRLGILHRDLRTANVLVASMDPVHVLLADLGVAHLLSAFAHGGSVGVTASKVSTVLTGAAAKGPALWMAPEVLAGEGVSSQSPAEFFTHC
jgi:serine/threonine protein kinase